MYKSFEIKSCRKSHTKSILKVELLSLVQFNLQIRIEAESKLF